MTERRRQTTIIIALIAALGSAGGGIFKAVMDLDIQDDFETVVAQKAAENETRWRRAEVDNAAFMIEIGRLREGVAALQATVEMLAQGRRDHRRIVESAGKARLQPRILPTTADLPVSKQQVSAKKKELFKK